MGVTRFGCLPPRLDGEQTKSGCLPAARHVLDVCRRVWTESRLNLDFAGEFGFCEGSLDSAGKKGVRGVISKKRKFHIKNDDGAQSNNGG
jgi:hypothetical protein